MMLEKANSLQNLLLPLSFGVSAFQGCCYTWQELHWQEFQSREEVVEKDVCTKKTKYVQQHASNRSKTNLPRTFLIRCINTPCRTCIDLRFGTLLDTYGFVDQGNLVYNSRNREHDFLSLMLIVSAMCRMFGWFFVRIRLRSGYLRKT